MRVLESPLSKEFLSALGLNQAKAYKFTTKGDPWTDPSVREAPHVESLHLQSGGARRSNSAGILAAGVHGNLTSKRTARGFWYADQDGLGALRDEPALGCMREHQYLCRFALRAPACTDGPSDV